MWWNVSFGVESKFWGGMYIFLRTLHLVFPTEACNSSMKLVDTLIFSSNRGYEAEETERTQGYSNRELHTQQQQAMAGKLPDMFC